MVDAPAWDGRIGDQTAADSGSIVDIVHPTVSWVATSVEVELLKECRARKGGLKLPGLSKGTRDSEKAQKEW